jgi:predicted DCC family thiol-disulfide oxidoreductase YuxK
MELPNKKIVLFDGVCNLCESSVQMIIKHDKKEAFVFASQQSETGKDILRYLGIDTKKMDAIVLYEPGVAYFIKSDAAMEILKEFPLPYSLLRIFRFLPLTFRDAVYDYIAKNRYRWYGKKEACWMPTKELRARFLDRQD